MQTGTGKRAALAALMAMAGLLAVPQAFAQAWPSRQPIKLVAVFPPGGSVDQVARILAVPLAAQLGANIIVENKGGASGSIGYTFADVVAAAKAKKNVSYGSIGSGSLGHLAMALLGKNGQIDWQHIPYKGGGSLMTDAVAGHVPPSIGSVFVTKPHIDSKRLRPLAVTTSKRSPDLLDVPTIAEGGFAGLDAPAWWAILAPANTPPDILKRMNEEINKALKSPEIAKKLDAQGIDVVGQRRERACLHRAPDGHLGQSGQGQQHQARLKGLSGRIGGLEAVSFPAKRPGRPGTSPPCCRWRSRW